jgi:hypothetical protein
MVSPRQGSRSPCTRYTGPLNAGRRRGRGEVPAELVFTNGPTKFTRAFIIRDIKVASLGTDY